MKTKMTMITIRPLDENALRADDAADTWKQRKNALINTLILLKNYVSKI